MPSRVLVLSFDPVAGGGLRGPALRYCALAEALTRSGHTATVLAPEVVGGKHRWADFIEAARVCDVVLAPRLSPAMQRHLRHAVFVWDAYVPTPFEAAHTGRAAAVAHARADALLAAARCDLALVAGDHQRGLVHGLLVGATRRSAQTVVHEQVRVVNVPFATDLRGGTPLAAPLEEVRLVWFGGLWPWMDWRPLVAAVISAGERDHRAWRLTLPPLPEEVSNDETVRRGRDQGVIEVLPEWVSPDRRLALLRAHHIGISLGASGLENDYSWRTRTLDYAGAGLPVLGRKGDVLAERAEREGWGVAVADGTAEDLVRQLQGLAESGGFGARSEAALAAASTLTWDLAAAPLVEALDGLTRQARANAVDTAVWLGRKVSAKALGVSQRQRGRR